MSRQVRVALVANSLDLSRRWGGTLVCMYLAKGFQKLGVATTLLDYEAITYRGLAPYDVVGTVDYAFNPAIFKRTVPDGVRKKVFFWAIDDPEIYKLPLQGYDHFFTHSAGSVQLHEALGRQNVRYLPFGYDPEIFSPPPADVQQDIDMIYIGNGIASKNYYVLDAAVQVAEEEGRSLQIYGRDWNKPMNHTYRKYLLGEADYRHIRELYWRSKVCLCLPGDIRIMAPLPVRISDVSKGDLVFGSDGHLHRVVDTICREYSGDIIEIVPRYLPDKIQLTPEHPVLAIKAQRCTYHSAEYICKPTCWNKACTKAFHRGYFTEWIPAKDVTPNHILLLPRIKVDPSHTKTRQISELVRTKTVVEDGNIYTEDRYGRINRNGHTLKNKIDITPDFMRFLGYYIAEGCEGDMAVIPVLNINEQPYAEDIATLTKSLFGVESSIKANEKKHSLRITCCSSNLSKAIRTLCGGSAHEKHIPAWAMVLPDEYIGELLKGLWRGDGCIEHCKWPRATYVTISPTLRDQIILLLARFGIVASSWANTTNTRKRGAYPAFNICVSGVDMGKLLAILDIDTRQPLPSIRRHHWVDPDYVYVPIREVRQAPYDGLVYNLKVDGTNDYLASGIVVHNCMHRKSQAETYGSYIMRDFEARACKSFVLSDWFKGGGDRFGATQVMARDKGEAVSLLRTYLKHEPLRKSSAKEGYLAVVHDTYEARAKQIIEALGKAR